MNIQPGLCLFSVLQVDLTKKLQTQFGVAEDFTYALEFVQNKVGMVCVISKIITTTP